MKRLILALVLLASAGYADALSYHNTVGPNTLYGLLRVSGGTSNGINANGFRIYEDSTFGVIQSVGPLQINANGGAVNIGNANQVTVNAPVSSTYNFQASHFIGDGSLLTGVASGGGSISKTLFIGAQTATFVVPTGVTAIKAHITSTGAAGAGATNSSWGAGAGGAAGDTAVKYITGLSAGQVISITIGTAPTGTTGAGAAGTEAYIQAPGTNKYYSGGASPAGAQNAGSNSAAFTSIGGNASNNAGIDCIPSATGAASADQCIVGGSGGGAFASASGIGLSGFGGNSFWGAGGGPQTIASGLAGVTPISCGAGGSGGSGNTHAGGGGGPGCVLLEYNAP